MPNRKADVELVQSWLHYWDRRFHPGSPGFSEGHLDSFTDMAIAKFQRETLGQHMPNGVVAPGDATAKKLASTPGPRPEGRILSLPPRSDYQPLNEEDYQKAAYVLKCEVRAIKAVGKVEGLNGDGFDHFNRPVILFEPTHFSSATGRAFDKERPELTHKKGRKYGSYEEQWVKLKDAYYLNANAALLATSWGKFQLLGLNYMNCGFAFIEQFAWAMCDSERNHLKGFVSFIKFSQKRLDALRTKDWVTFATYYNGSAYAEYNYDKKLQRAYEDLGK